MRNIFIAKDILYAVGALVKTNPNKANSKRSGYAALRSACKNTLLFTHNLVKWTLGDLRQRQFGMLDTRCWILDLILLPTTSIENRVSRIEFQLCIE